MNDKNGIELRTGQIVEITGGFFKADNGRFAIVETITGEGENGCWQQYSLRKVTKKNEFAITKYTQAFWPIAPNKNGYETKKKADAHNKEHAQIEVVDEMENVEIKSEIAFYEIAIKYGRYKEWQSDFFRKRIDELKAQLNA